MRSRAALASTSVALLTLLLGTTGCVGPLADDPDDPGTSTSTQDPAGRQLDETSAELALPIIGDLPAGLSIDEQPTAQITDQRSEPKGCLDASFSGEEREKIADHQVAEAERSYTHQTKSGSARVLVRSYDIEVPDALFVAAGKAVADCTTMKRFTTLEGEDGPVVDTLRISGLSVPPVGERTFASRFTLTDSSEPLSRGGVADYLAFRRGHTLVTVVYFVGPRSERVEDLTSTLAAIVDRNLAEG